MALESYKAVERKVSLDCADLFGVLFVALKLTHVIGWSWWWVTAPLWIPPVLVGVVKGLVEAFKK